MKFAKSFTATSYTILLVDVTNPTDNKSEVLSPQEGDNGPWEHTLTAPAKATYRFEVRGRRRVSQPRRGAGLGGPAARRASIHLRQHSSCHAKLQAARGTLLLLPAQPNLQLPMPQNPTHPNAPTL